MIMRTGWILRLSSWLVAGLIVLLWPSVLAAQALGQASNPAPPDGATNVPVTTSLAWTAAPNATKYDIRLGTTNPPAIVARNVSGTTYQPSSPLAPGTTYYWQVIARGKGNASTPGPIWTFTTAPVSQPAPSVPSSPSPSDGATNIAIITALAWAPSTNATAYDVAFGTTQTPPVVSSNQVETSYDPPGDLPSATTYYWRVTAHGPGGSTLGPLWTFTTSASSEPAPSAPTSPIPADGATSIAVNAALEWAASTNATSYDVAFGTTDTPPVVSSSQAGTSYDPPGDLANGTTYFWRVTANGPGGSTPGPLWIFTTAPAPPNPAPAPAVPADGATDVPTATSLSWTAVPGTTKYDVRLGTTNPPSILARNVNGTTYQPPTPLAPSTTYYWAVDARGQGNLVTPGPVWTFTTAVAPSTPSSPAPADGTTSVAVTVVLAWDASSDATSYDVAFGTTTTPPVVSSSQTGTTFDPPGSLTNATTYYWRVTAKGPGGPTPGPLWSFTTIAPAPSVPSSPTPADNATNSAIAAVLDWAASANATAYDVAFGTTASPPVVSADQTGTGYDPPGDLSNATTYYWQVTAKGPGGSTPGPLWTFTTAAAPGALSSPTPTDGATDAAITAAVGWAASANATGYDVAFGTTNAPPTVSSDQTATSYDPPGDLANATTYYWRVTAKGPGGSTPGPLWTFTTAAAPENPPSTPASPSPSDGAANVSVIAGVGWTASTNATGYDVEFGTTTTPPVVSSNQAATTYDPPGDLANATTYYWRVTARGPGGSTPGQLWSFTTAGASSDPSGFVSDDFNVCTVDQGAGAWTFSDPLGGAWHRTVGVGSGEAWLEIFVPAGIAHDPWNAQYNAPRLMRPISNTDFELEVKFLSPMSAGFQAQGILIEQDSSNYVRFDFLHDGSGVRIFAARTTAGVSTSEYYATAIDSVPQYMRIKRQGNQWTQTYSADGTTWTTAASFFHALTPSQAGVFAANGGADPPAHTAQFDYIFSTATPLVSEDGAASTQNYTLTVGVSGDGTVSRNPDLPTYPCGSLVQLTATPDFGSTFSGWSGDLDGTQNPAIIFMGADKAVQALFSGLPPPQPPVISNVQVVTTPTTAEVTWTTDKPASSRVDYGLSSAYGETVEDAALVTSHSISLVNLNASTTYHFTVMSTTSDGGSATSGDLTFQTAVDPSGFVSDDFNVCVLDEGAGGWTFSDPLGGASHRTVGVGSGEAWLEISVPQGVAHDPWNTSYNAPRIMRPISDTDFELEVKFLSPMTLGYQMQGILIEQDRANYLRFELHHDGSDLKVFAARTTNGVSAAEYNVTVVLGVPQYMRIRRQGNEWIQTYSADGTFWTMGARFSHTLSPSQAGVFAANAAINVGSSPPAHIGQFDYIVSTARRVVPEDGAAAGQFFTLSVSGSGPGTVTRDPDQSTYACGSLVTLTATPDPGYTFNGWSGDLVSNLNPVTIATTQDKSISGEFVLNVPPVISDLSILPGDNWATVSWVTNEPSTTEVEYGLTPSLELGSLTRAEPVTQHSIHVTGLNPQTTYHLRLTSRDNDGGSSSVSDLTFTTTSAFPLAISNVQVAAQDTSATVTWTTNKPSTSAVDYGLGPTLGLGSVSDNALKTTHAMTLAPLDPGTQYYYRISVTDGSGVPAQSNVLTFTTPQIAPVFRVWYGEQQRFGHLGTPQTWVNILGNVSDPDGVQFAQFSLNGGPLRQLSLGPDTRRLAYEGDFNVELRYVELTEGPNTIRIVASDRLGHVSEKTIVVDATLGTTWPTPYSVDFSTVTNVQDVGQVVDGRWVLENGALRSVAPWYDRLVAIGDVTWKNYEVTASITTHSFDPAGYEPPSYGAAVGLIMRWKGHSIWDNSQPSWGYWPAGAIASYQWQPDGSERIALIGNQGDQVSMNPSPPLLQFGRSYVFKVRVQTQSNGQHLYQFKMWPADLSEPAFWQQQILTGNLPDDPTHGSLLLFAHHVDASFEAVAITPLPDASDPDPLPEPPAQTDIMVIAPHPDDDVITASGVIRRAVQNGQSVRVVYVTNGDVHGVNWGVLRQGEAVNGQGVLGVLENRLVFLGYPDGGLGIIRNFYTSTDSQFTSGDGVSATYASHGLGGVDYHTYRFGAAGPYNWPTMVGDLADLINTTRPSHIFTTSQWDTHSDHHTTYWLVRQATQQVIASGTAYNPTIHATTVWPDEIRDDAPWPSEPDPTAYFSEPPVSAAGTPDWIDRESLDVPSIMQSTDYSNNLKVTAISAHQSQLAGGYIQRFLHKDEFFWTEQLTGLNQPPVPNAGLDQTVQGGVQVTLNGSDSWDRNGSIVTYQWRQVGGPTVTLSDATASHPTFVAPAGISAAVVLEFELVVSDGTLVSVPDAVRIVVQPGSQ